MMRHPGVTEAAVVEAPLREGVSGIVAFYVPASGTLREEDLSAHCARHLARYKCPRAFRAVEALPRSTNGKLIRRRLGQEETAR
jgi:long-chain acyl-CoA synthetase